MSAFGSFVIGLVVFSCGPAFEHTAHNTHPSPAALNTNDHRKQLRHGDSYTVTHSQGVQKVSKAG
jgi:hypothetical protein